MSHYGVAHSLTINPSRNIGVHPLHTTPMFLCRPRCVSSLLQVVVERGRCRANEGGDDLQAGAVEKTSRKSAPVTSIGRPGARARGAGVAVRSIAGVDGVR